jgi:ABC-type branched-subunit amino acid transport system permease subunit
MAGDDDITPVPDRPGEGGPKVGVDSWVASYEGRRDRGSGLFGRLRYDLGRAPRPTFYIAFAVLAALLPLITSNGYVIRVGFDTLLYMMLALGLNIVVGLAGLLDLGYIAFYGFGAYAYAMLASPKFGIHWDTLLIIPVVLVATALLGLLVALPSRRLSGDYLAIVTLFFLQFFVTVVQNGERVSFLGLTRGYDLTGGPNGIPNIDNWDLGGYHIRSLAQYYYTALVVFLIVLAAVYLLDTSRTGRAWKSLREDSLAAELMGMPVNRLKLIAFSFGAAVAGLAGALFAGLNTAVFAADFDVPTLILIYAMLILGGAGSLGGVIVGALVVNVSLEILRTPEHATWIFYGAIIVALVLKLRPWAWFFGVVGGTIVFGLVIHAISAAWWPRGVEGEPTIGGTIGKVLDRWMLHPTNPQTLGNIAFIALVFVVLGLTLLHGWVQKLALIPTLWLTGFVWDNRLVVEPSITRLILLGVILIVLMNARPQGLLGTARVEIV